MTDNAFAVRPLLAEYLGVFFLVLITGVVFSAAPVSDIAGALTFAFTIAIAVAATAHISGGHINPAVTVALWVGRQVRTVPAALYLAAQAAGGIAGAYAAAGLVPGDADLGITATVVDGVSLTQAAFVEAIMAFFLVWTVFAVAVDGRSKTPLAPLFIGLAVGVNILFGAALTGASMNPARYLGPAIVAAEFSDAWVYLAMPFVGGALAALLCRFALLPRAAGQAKPAKRAGARRPADS